MLRRFYLPDPLAPQMTVTGSEARHMLKVLRLTAGQHVIVFDRDGKAGRFEIGSVAEGCADLRLVAMLDENRESPIEVILVQGLPKGDKMDHIVQKAVELGVSAIYPWQADTSVVVYDENKQRSRRERWQKIAAEAAKQCRRTQVPPVASVSDLATVLAVCDPNAAILLLYEGQAVMGIRQALTDRQASCYVLIIGPEGGISQREIALAESLGAVPVSMGPRILRTETAALAALTVVLYHHGDVGG